MNRPSVSVYQACANALAAWLKQALPGNLRVEPRWVESTVPASAGEDRSVTILLAGQPTVDLESPQLDPDSPPEQIDSHTKLYTWIVRAFRQPLQLDAWAKYDIQRDDLVALLDVALNAGDQLTLGAYNGDPVSNGVVLPLGDSWPGHVSIYFDGPNNLDTRDSNQQSQFRTTYIGWADAVLTVKAASPALAAIELQQRLAQTLPVPANTATDTTTVTASS